MNKTKTPTLPALTDEQIAIINSSGDIVINAVAGSGKTTTLLEYAASRPSTSKFLYLAFNKSVKQEATRKFLERGLRNVKVETAHSLAFRQIIPKYNYKVRAMGYKTQEIAELLKFRVQGEKHAEYIVANHVNKFITYFCNSKIEKVQQLNYLDTIADDKARTFVKTFYKIIENGTRQLLAKMEKGEIEVTHDFYLKKFQLSNPVLNYDYILFDEGQDASEAMLDVFLKQKATKLIVGDAHQQIYAWRFAVNSLEKTGFAKFTLNTSFRFNQSIADLAMKVLSWKKYLAEFQPVAITGKGTATEKKTKATIARSNLGLLIKAIEYIKENQEARHIYFEGNINSYTYADDGTSLYDVLNLYNQKRTSIKDKLIGSMKDMFELEDYIKKTEDVQLGMMVEIVTQYGNEIYPLIRKLKELHTGDGEKSKAEMIFSTVHKSKGMEYDSVQLVNDFIKEEKLEKLKEKANEEPSPKNAKWKEEINLLYVAITRTKNFLTIPDVLVPKDFTVTENIEVIKTKPDIEDLPPEFGKSRFSYRLQSRLSKERTYNVMSKVEENKLTPKAYKPWTQELDDELIQLYNEGLDTKKIKDHFERTEGAIRSRLRKLGCISYEE